MFNWNTDEEKLKREHPREHKLWRLVQLINYGLDGEKLNKKELISNWGKIKDRLVPDNRKTLEFFLWHRKWRPELKKAPFHDWYTGKVIRDTFECKFSLKTINDGYGILADDSRIIGRYNNWEESFEKFYQVIRLQKLARGRS